MLEKKPKGWQKGQSGNPKGREPGTGELQRLRASIAADVPEILAGLATAAKGGDVQAAKLLLERVFPAVKPVDNTHALDIPKDGSLTDQGRAVIAAVSDGELSPANGAQLVTALGTLARVAEIDELSERIKKLEEHHAKH
jgi:hypothetical protein